MNSVIMDLPSPPNQPCSHYLPHFRLEPSCLLAQPQYLEFFFFKSKVLFFLAVLHSMWDLSSSTRDQTHASCSGSSES